MKITTKVALGFLSVNLIAAGVYTYQLFLIENMQRVESHLSEVGFQVGLTAHKAYESLLNLEEYSLKYRNSGDEFYLDEAASLRSEIADNLRTLMRRSLLEPILLREIEPIQEEWIRCEGLISQLKNPADSESAPYEERLSGSVGRILEGLERLLEVNDRFLEETAADSSRMRGRLTSISLILPAATVGLAFLVSFLVYSSVASSLSHLILGARRIAVGDFTARLPESKRDELSELAVAMNRMAARLGELDQLKKDFISHVSHDLRAPLASIQETTRLLLDDLSAGLSDTQKKLLEFNLASSKRLSGMVGDLLDLSRLEAGSMAWEFETVALENLLREILENLHGLCREKSLSVDIVDQTPPVQASVDRARMLQVFGNLLSNSMEYVPPRSRITVRLETLDRIPREAPFTWNDGLHRSVRISFLDQGPGIPDNLKEKIFDQFTAFGSGGNHFGTGLGLAIARKIVEAHKGVIWVEDNPEGRGSCFSIMLPGP